MIGAETRDTHVKLYCCYAIVDTSDDLLGDAGTRQKRHEN